MWQLLEHMRIAQEDILDFCVNAEYVDSRKWPDDYRPADPEPPGAGAWDDTVASFERDWEQLRTLARETKDLYAPAPAGNARQTYLRGILLVVDHNAYHLGQLVAVRRALGFWNGRSILGAELAMSNSHRIVLAALLGLGLVPGGRLHAANGLALTPPMGWNSWNKFGCNVSERLIEQAADAMVATGMKDAGYQYVVIDDCWQVSRDDAGTHRRRPAAISATA